MSEFEKLFRNGEALKHDLEDYWHGVAGEGDLGYEWQDKPHRLVFDLISAVLYERYQARAWEELHAKDTELLAAERDRLRARAEKAEAMLEDGRKLAKESYEAACQFKASAEKAETTLAKIAELNEGWHGRKDCDCHTCETLRIAQEALAARQAKGGETKRPHEPGRRGRGEEHRPAPGDVVLYIERSASGLHYRPLVWEAGMSTVDPLGYSKHIVLMRRAEVEALARGEP